MAYTRIRADAAVKVAAGLGVHCDDPVILADGANVVVHLSPAPVVAKVAASTTEVRPAADWLQRELDVTGYLAGRGAPVMTPSPEVNAVSIIVRAVSIAAGEPSVPTSRPDAGSRRSAHAGSPPSVAHGIIGGRWRVSSCPMHISSS